MERFKIEDKLDYVRMRQEGTEFSYWNAGYLRGMSINSNLPLISSPGNVLSYNGLEWTSTVSSGFAKFGNVLIVDLVYGNDLTASVGGNPYKTIQGAINSITTNGCLIWLMPGTYNLLSGITIPQNTTIRGVSLQSCIIQMLGVISNTTLITMSNNSRLEDITLNLSSNIDVSLKGIYFPLQTSITAKVRVCLINVNSNSTTLSNIVCGIFSDGSTLNPNVVLSTNAVQRSTTNVSSLTSGGGIVRGWYFTGPLQFSVRDSVIFSKGTNSIGIETVDTSSFIIIKTSTIAGDLQDIKNPIYNSGNPIGLTNCGIQLCSTDLIHSNAGNTSFISNVETADIIFSVFGNVGNTTHYLFPGTFSYNALSNTPLGIPFLQDTIIFGGMLSIVGIPNSGGTITINLYKSNSSTTLSVSPFLSLVGTSTNQIAIFNNKSSTFLRQTDFLHVELITTGLNGGNNVSGIYLSLSIY